jgi:hypothetical protein
MISRWLFKLFGEFRFVAWLLGFGILMQVIGYAAIIYTIVHFVQKFW